VLHEDTEIMWNILWINIHFFIQNIRLNTELDSSVCTSMYTNGHS